MAFLPQPTIPLRFTVIDECADWLVVDKPPFMEAHPSKPNGRATLWDGLRGLLAYELANGGQVSIINRLDRETSGLTLVAKHRAAAREFHRHMEARHIEKEYLALVWGWPESEAFDVDVPILRQGSRGPSPIYLKQAVHPDGAAARTRFRVEGNFTLETTNGDRFALIDPRVSGNRPHAPDPRAPRPCRASGRRRQDLRPRRRRLSRIHSHGLDSRTGRAPPASPARFALHRPAAAGRRARLAIAPRAGPRGLGRGKFARGARKSLHITRPYVTFWEMPEPFRLPPRLPR
ncbi:MAG: pseudouridine synthase [Chthoniobacter sp.]